MDRRRYATLQRYERERHARLVQFAQLPLWNRIQRRQLRCALARWRRRARLVGAHAELKQQLVQHRLYLLRKTTLNLWVARLALGFRKWLELCRSYQRLRLRLEVSWRRQRLRLAWRKWREKVQTERLDEEAAACLCVMWTFKLERLTQRSATRADRGRLVDGWVAWKRWCRRRRCLKWRRRMPLARRKWFYAWTRYLAAIQAARQAGLALVGAIVHSLVDDCVAQSCWREQARNYQNTAQITTIRLLLHRWRERIARQHLTDAFAHWRRILHSDGEEVAKLESPDEASGEDQALTFPRRFAAAYRLSRRKREELAKSRHRHRPSWR